jgi:ATP-binding cassette subfamily C (CFTR/MRP) protein 1
MGIYQTLISFSWGIASFLVATASFVTFILIDKNNDLDASTAFVSLTLFNTIRFPLMIFPMIITSLIQVFLYIRKIYLYFNLNNLEKIFL